MVCSMGRKLFPEGVVFFAWRHRAAVHSKRMPFLAVLGA